jgi:hypothetical protein
MFTMVVQDHHELSDGDHDQDQPAPVSGRNRAVCHGRRRSRGHGGPIPLVWPVATSSRLGSRQRASLLREFLGPRPG